MNIFKVKRLAAALLWAASAWLTASVSGGTSEISVNLKLDQIDYVYGERVRGVVEVVNTSPFKLSVGHPDSKDLLFVEVFSSSDMVQLRETNRRAFTAKFTLDVNEAQKLEVYLGDHYGLRQYKRFLARPVLVHDGRRYEGQYRAFDVVPGMAVSDATQVFANRDGLSRVFSLVRWARKGTQHLFIVAHDEGVSEKPYETRDLGAMMTITKPTVSILPGGQVIVVHRTGPDHFIRSEFWSMPDALEFHTRELVSDPETAGQNRVQQLYQESGGVKPVERPWWKFW